jgi:hypothetical protein
MVATLEVVERIIQEAFPGSRVEVTDQENHRLVGTIYWKGFKGMDMTKRTQLVTERVREPLGLDGLNVGILFPLAPGEQL